MAMTLVIGGASSGKSEYAESIFAGSKDIDKYYIATMKVSSDEDRKRVERHLSLRNGKGYKTIEQEKDVCKISFFSRGDAILEDLPNLLANEMFEDINSVPEASLVAGKITEDILKLNKHFDSLVIVSDNVFDDGEIYDEFTVNYLKALSIIHRKLSEQCDQVIEVVAGIPIIHKG